MAMGGRLVFTSKPNQCTGCPLNREGNLHKVPNMCKIIARGTYDVEHQSNDTGKEVCNVYKKEWDYI